MLSEEPAKKISQLSKVKKVGYKDYRLWMLVEDETDLLECEKVPKVKSVKYYLVTHEKDIPAHVKIINN